MYIWLENHSDFLCSFVSLHIRLLMIAVIFECRAVYFYFSVNHIDLCLIVFPRLVDTLLRQFHNTAQADFFSFIFYLFIFLDIPLKFQPLLKLL